jgi:hypothetical protein
MIQSSSKYSSCWRLYHYQPGRYEPDLYEHDSFHFALVSSEIGYVYFKDSQLILIRLLLSLREIKLNY